jgi:hypothetical protein
MSKLLRLNKLIENITIALNRDGFITDDLVDKHGNPFRDTDGKECSMYEKFKEDLTDFITGYKYNTKGSVEIKVLDSFQFDNAKLIEIYKQTGENND